MLNPVFYYRLARWLYLRRIPLLPQVVQRLSVLVFHCYLPYMAEIGEGFEVGYWGIGVVIHPRTRIGRSVFVAQGVTIGGRAQSPHVPRIEDKVFIAAGAKVLGDIVIGEGSVIGANAVVIHTVPPRSIAVGVPARIVRQNVDVYDYTGWPPQKEPSLQADAPTKHDEHKKRALHVFFMVDSLNLGGSENQLVQTARRLNSEGFSVKVGCLHAEGPFVKTLHQAGIPVVEFPPRGGFFTPRGLYELLRLARFLRRERFDVVHTYDLYSNLMGIPAAWLARVPIRISSRRDLGSWWWYTRRNRKLLRWVLGLSRFVVANSDAVRNFLVREDGYDAGTIRVIRNGIDPDPFLSVAPNRGRLFPDVGSRDKLIAVVANMNVNTKGHLDLLNAARLICPVFPDARFVLVGDGRERLSLESKVDEWELRKNVLFLGHRTDVPYILSCCDLFVLPSWAEGLPNVVLEALAAGLPVVATRVGGIPEIIEDGANGLLVSPHDPPALATAILKLLKDKELAQRCAREGRIRVCRQFTFDRVLQQVKELYEEAWLRADGAGEGPGRREADPSTRAQQVSTRDFEGVELASPGSHLPADGGKGGSR